MISMYARGMSACETRVFLAETYCTEVPPDFISSVADEAIAETPPDKAACLKRCTQWCSSTRCAWTYGTTAW